MFFISFEDGSLTLKSILTFKDEKDLKEIEGVRYRVSCRNTFLNINLFYWSTIRVIQKFHGFVYSHTVIIIYIFCPTVEMQIVVASSCALLRQKSESPCLHGLFSRRGQGWLKGFLDGLSQAWCCWRSLRLMFLGFTMFLGKPEMRVAKVMSLSKEVGRSQLASSMFL